MPNKNHNIPPRLRAAVISANSFNEKDTSIEVVAATDSEVLQVSWDGIMSEVLSMEPAHVRMERFLAGAQALDNHQRYGSVRDSVVGVVTAARLEKGKLICTIKFSEREELKGFIQDVKSGIIRNISIGYRVYKYQITEEEGKIPVYRAIDWEPFEVSFVAVPADYLAGVRSQKDTDNEVVIISTNQNKNKMKRSEILKLVRAANFSMEFAQTLIDDDNITVEQVRAKIEEEKTRLAGTGNPASAATEPKKEVKETEEQMSSRFKKEGNKRATEILNSVRAGGLDVAFAQELIDDESITVEQARGKIIEKMASTDTQRSKTNSTTSPAATAGADGVEKFRDAAITGMVLRSGQVKEEKLKPEQVLAGRSFQGTSLIRFAAICLERAGINISGMSDMEIAKRAITTSTSDFPVVLESVLHKMLLSQYAIVPDTWRQFCAVGSVTDFRAHKRLRPGSFSRLDQVLENGELKNKAIADAKAESITAKTFGNIINIGRNTIINDDLGYFGQMTASLGRAAARGIEIDVYALLAANPTMTDGVALFHATHNNLITGAAPSVASFDAMRVAMKKQKDDGGNDYLDIKPSVLVIGASQGAAADAINDSVYDPDAANKLQKKNTSYKTFEKIVDTARITGNEMYAFADPNVLPVLEVAFLNGVQTPYLEQETSFEQLGLRWRIYHDYAVGAIDWKGAVKNPGA